MARSQPSEASSDRAIDHDIDRIVERIRQDIPEIPYYLSVPSEYPYRLLNPALRDQWRKDTWFEPHEEHLQYSTFVWRDSATSLFQLYPFPADDSRKTTEPASTLTPTPNHAPKKKITLAAYKNKSKTPASVQTQTLQDLPQPPSPASSTPRPSSRTNNAVQETSIKHGAAGGSANTTDQSSKRKFDAEKTKPEVHTATKRKSSNQQQDIAMESMPWLPNSQTSAAFEHLPPRLSPLVPANSILHMPSPGALQRHALASLVGSKSSPLQVTLSLPSSFTTEPEASSRRGKEQESSPHAENSQSSLIVKLRVPSLKQRKRRPTGGEEEEPSSKRSRNDHADRENGETMISSQQNGRPVLDSPQLPHTSLKSKATAAEWQAETVRTSKLGKISKSASTDVFKESELSTDVKEQTRLRKIAGVRALEALLRFLQSFVAKSQSRPNSKGILPDWISFLPYSSDVVAVTRHFPHLHGLALLLQSVASAQIVAVCSSIRATDDVGSKDENKEAAETLSTMQKYSLYTQQKSVEAGKILTRKTLAEDYPKAYAASLEQPLGSGLQPMPAFRMAVHLLDEWSSHQGIEWEPLDEGLCSRL